MKYTEAPRLKMDPGQYLFVTECGACHTIGRGDNIGPDLMGVTSLREHAWLERKIAQPDALLAEGDPLTKVLFEKYKQIRMPNLHLDHEATDLLIGFMARQSTAPAAAPVKAEGKSVQGQPR
jgi:protein SCO1/2